MNLPSSRVAMVIIGVWLVAPLPLAAQAGPPERLPAVPAASAWEQSLALEARADLVNAKQLLIDAFGKSPATYDVSVRLAWLTLRQGKGAEAADLYRRARTLPGSLPEATTGLGLALTARGYSQLERGALGEARSSWSEALTIDASNTDALKGIDLVGGGIGPSIDVWTAGLSATVNSSKARVFYTHVLARVDNDLAVRAAVRQVASPTFTGTSGAFAKQTEFYAGISRDMGISTNELIGFVITGTGRSNSGAAVTTRIGGNYGILASASIIARTGGTNLQIVPTAFWYASPNLSLSGGVRVTSDSAFSSVSPLASITWRNEKFLADVAAHFGKQQWAFSATGPSILSFLDKTSSGLTGTLGWQLSRSLAFYGQLQAEQTVSSGSFQSIGAGVHFTPR